MTENEILIKAADTIDESVAVIKLEVRKTIMMVGTKTVTETVPKYTVFGIRFGKKEIEKTERTLTPEQIVDEETFYIRPATLRTMIRISRQMIGAEFGKTPEGSEYLPWAINVIADNGENQAKIIATAIHNQKEEVPQNLVDTILDNFSGEDLWKVTQVVLDKLNIIPFMNTITSTKSLQVLKMKTVSPLEQGEIIASGEQSEVLSSILGSATIIH